MSTPARIIGGAVLVLASGCSAKLDKEGLQVEGNRSASLSSGGEDGDGAVGKQHCDASDAMHEESSYDTSGDDIPDVRKVFLRVGVDQLTRLVLVCRESDLNSDGVKDVVRYYSDEGEPLREEADRDFDGQMDEVTIFQEARILRQEFDTNADGKVDLKIFFKDGEPLRSERDMAGRSTAAKWQPDRWEYYEEGRMVRMGTDLDGDGTVDRWDRDETIKARKADLRTDENVVDSTPDEAEGEDAEGGEDAEEG